MPYSKKMLDCVRDTKIMEKHYARGMNKKKWKQIRRLRFLFFAKLIADVSVRVYVLIFLVSFSGLVSAGPLTRARVCECPTLVRTHAGNGVCCSNKWVEKVLRCARGGITANVVSKRYKSYVCEAIYFSSFLCRNEYNGERGKCGMQAPFTQYKTVVIVNVETWNIEAKWTQMRNGTPDHRLLRFFLLSFFHLHIGKWQEWKRQNVMENEKNSEVRKSVIFSLFWCARLPLNSNKN